MSESQGKQDGFWGFMKSALGFFERVLDAVKNDTRLAILWGFGVLLLVLLVATLFIARDLPPIGKGIFAALVVIVLTFLFVYTLQRTESPKPSISEENGIVQGFTSDDIVFDFSHRQEDWRPSPSLDAGYRRVKGVATGLGWNVASIDKVGWLTSVPPRMGALVLVCPYHRELEKGEIEGIIKYVSNGGKLLVLGYFCIPHHSTNLNDLMSSLGISFKYDLVLPLPPYQSEGTYWRPEEINPKYIVRVGSQSTKVDPIVEATNIASYGFSLPNGDWLFALWTDGVAVDDDPGVPATLTFPMSHITVTGIDVLQGFEQELIASEEGGNLVIRDLLVKDYPIILRLSPTRYVFLPIVLKGYPR